MTRDEEHAWHTAINRYTETVPPDEWPHWMYEAKDAYLEVPRLKSLFQEEREHKLPTEHRQCSQSPVEPIPDNALTCCLGVRCAECPFLQAVSLEGEAGDEAKAWTCATHIIASGGDQANEGYVLTTGDRIYWDRVYQSLAQGQREAR